MVRDIEVEVMLSDALPVGLGATVEMAVDGSTAFFAAVTFPPSDFQGVAECRVFVLAQEEVHGVFP